MSGNPAAATSTTRSRPLLLTPDFGRLAITAMAFFFSMGATFPVLPRFVKDDLGGTDTTVGLVIGATALGAVVARPAIGFIGDRRGRRLLMILGGVVAAAAHLALVVVGDVATLMVLRVIFGVGQGAFFVGATTLAVDLADVDRRGEATSYIFVALHFGSGLGPLVGEWALGRWDFDATWYIAAAGCAVAALAAITVPNVVGSDLDLEQPRMRLVHPRAVLPGVVLGIGIIGFVGFNAFVPLYGEEIGVDNIAPLFLISSFTIVAIRFFGARLPDRLGPVRGGTAALVGMAAGMSLIGFVDSAGGLYAGTVVMSCGTALLLPSLVSAAVDGVPANERSTALATYTLFMEFSLAIGAVIFGAVAGASSYGAAFVLAAVMALIALALLWARMPRHLGQGDSTAREPATAG
ncbi:MAG: MFS transporter [Actinomycetota bacterium]